MSNTPGWTFVPFGTPNIEAQVSIDDFGASSYVRIPLIKDFAGQGFPIELIIPFKASASDPFLNLSCVNYLPMLKKTNTGTLKLSRPGQPTATFVPDSGQSYECRPLGERIEESGDSSTPYLTLYAADGTRWGFPVSTVWIRPFFVSLPNGLVMIIEQNGLSHNLYVNSLSPSETRFAASALTRSDGSLSYVSVRTVLGQDELLAEATVSSDLTEIEVTTWEGSAKAQWTFRLTTDISGSKRRLLSVSLTAVDDSLDSLVPDQVLSITHGTSTLSLSCHVNSTTQSYGISLEKLANAYAKLTGPSGRSTFFSLLPSLPSQAPKVTGTLSDDGSWSHREFDTDARVVSTAKGGLASEISGVTTAIADPSFLTPSAWVWSGQAYRSLTGPVGCPSSFGQAWAFLPSPNDSVSCDTTAPSGEALLLAGEPCLVTAIACLTSSSTVNSIKVRVDLTLTDGTILTHSDNFYDQRLRPNTLCALPVDVGGLDRAAVSARVTVIAGNGNAAVKQIQWHRGATMSSYGYDGPYLRTITTSNGTTTLVPDPGDDAKISYRYGASGSSFMEHATPDYPISVSFDDIGGREQTNFSNVAYGSTQVPFRFQYPSNSTSDRQAGKIRSSNAMDAFFLAPSSSTSEGISAQYSYDSHGRTCLFTYAGRQTSVEYDEAGRTTRLVDSGFTHLIGHSIWGPASILSVSAPSHSLLYDWSGHPTAVVSGLTSLEEASPSPSYWDERPLVVASGAGGAVLGGFLAESASVGAAQVFAWLGISAAVSFAGGIGAYAVETFGHNSKWDWGEAIGGGLMGMAAGIFAYGAGGLSKLVLSSGRWITRLVLQKGVKFVFSWPLKFTEGRLIDFLS